MKCILTPFLLFVLALMPIVVISQNFTEIPGLGGDYQLVEYTDEHGVMFVGGTELHISNDDGLTWLNVNNGIGSTLENHVFFGAVALSTSKYCILTEKIGREYIFLTIDGGVTWTQQYQSISGITNTGNVIDAMNDTLMVPTAFGVLKSVDGGLNWSPQVFSTSYSASEVIIYNNQSQKWYVATEDEGVMVSADQGVSWVQLNVGINGVDVKAVSTHGTKVIFTTLENDLSKLYFISDLGVLEKTVNIPTGVLEGGGNGGDYCGSAGLTPSGVLLTESDEAFYYVDTLTENVYYYTFPGYNVLAIGGIELGPNKGLAFRSGNFNSAAYLIDYSVAPSIYPPANFKIHNSYTTCAGDDINVSVYNTGSDSVRWYVDNQYHSTGYTASISTLPNAFVTYTIRSEAYFNGAFVEHTESKTLTVPQPPDAFTYTVDSTPCYGSNVNIKFMGSSSFSSNTTMEVRYGGTTIYGPQMLISSLTSAFIQNISSSDSIMFITKNNNPCYTTSDTTYKYIQVDPTILDFGWSISDTVVCFGDTVKIELYNTHPMRDYIFLTASGSVLDTYSGVGSDTITHFINTEHIPNNFNPSFVDSVFTEVNLNVEKWGGTCSEDMLLPSIRIYMSESDFRIHQKSYEVGTPVEVSNYLPFQNRTWSSTSLLPSELTQISDTVPFINSSVPGFHNLTLKNAPYPGCFDESTEYVQYAEISPSIDNCEIKTAPSNKKIFQTKFDRDGNLYSLGGFRTNANYNYGTIYSLERYSGIDSVLWSIKGDPHAYDTYGAVIEGFDFDKENNVICVGWLSYNNNNYDDGIMKSDHGNSSFDLKLYVFKINGSDGSLMWKREITQMPINVPNTTDGAFRVTDIAVSDEYIYVSAYFTTRLQFIALNLDGTYNNHSEMVVPAFGSNKFLTRKHPLSSSYGSALRDTYGSPKLKVLSNGDLLALGRFGSIPGTSYPELDLGTTSSSGMFAMKYNTLEGVHDIEAISTHGFAVYTRQGQIDKDFADPVYFDVDENDNIYVSSFIEGIYFKDNEKISVLDSTLLSYPLSYIFKMDSDYNLDWITTGTQSRINGLSYSRITKGILVSGTINQTIGYSSDSVHIFNGDPMNINHDTSSVTAIYPLDFMDLGDSYLAGFDSLGNPAFIEIYDNEDHPMVWGFESNLAATPCGDYVVHIYGLNSNYEIDGDTIAIDSLSMITGSAGCNFDCMFFLPEDSVLVCAANNMVRVFPKEYFGIDSISYSISSNGVSVVSNQYGKMVNGAIEVDIPQQLINDSTFYISYDNYFSTDSTFVSFIPAPDDVIYTYDSLHCTGNILNFAASPANYHYEWLSNGGTGSQFSLEAWEYSVGNNEIYVSVTRNNGCQIIDNLNFHVDNCLDVAEFEKSTFIISPNPNNGTFRIELSEAHTVQEILILNAYGRKLETRDAKNKHTLFFDLKLSAGVYFVMFEEAQKTIMKRIVIM